MRRSLIVLALAVLAVSALAQPPGTRPAGPMTLVLKDGSRIQGVPVSADENTLVFQVAGQKRTLPLGQISPISVYLARRSLTDLGSPATHMELGKYLLENGLAPQAKKEFEEAVRLDPSLGATVKELLASAPATAPASAPAPRTPHALVKPKEEAEIIKYQPPTTQQVEAAMKQVEDWADKARAFVPSLHTVETPNFFIYSAWDRNNDKPLSETCERMYKAMCQQFDIPPDQNIWVGKCAVFVFWETSHFKRFSTEVCTYGNPDAAGYCGYNSEGMVFIVMGPARTKTWFYEVLVHEATHGFISRYLSNRGIPMWLNEGLADYMAGNLVPGALAGSRPIDATKKAVKEKIDVSRVLKNVELEAFDYGIAQSFVQYLIARDRKAFIKLVTLLKEGRSEEEAMKQAYNLTSEQFLRAWTAAAIEAVQRPRRGG